MPIIAPMVTANAETIADVLASRFDALAYYLETMPVTWGDGKVSDATLLDDDFSPATATLDLSSFAIFRDGSDEAPVTNIRFALPQEANTSSEDGGKSKGGAPRKYDGDLAALKAEIRSNPAKARGLTTKAAIYREIAARFSKSNPGDPKTTTNVEKAFSDNVLAQSFMNEIVSIARNLHSK
ncbi:MAG: hypothetical protein K2X10_13165 [Hyphomicrobiales bacterium]|nr:hypothetical protein [Hyphomicrobiales bacterium]